MDYTEKLSRIESIVQAYVDRQGHDRCWYLPELLDPLAELLGIEARHPKALPPREEFCKGCARYQDEQYGQRESRS